MRFVRGKRPEGGVPRPFPQVSATGRLTQHQVAAIAIACLTLVVGCAAFALVKEETVAASDARLFDQSQAIDRSAAMNGYIEPDDSAGPARSRISDALFMARSAAAMKPSRERLHLLDQALFIVEEARTVRPHWGEAALVRAYILQQRSGSDDPATVDAIVESYRYAPFMQLSAVWRSGIVMENWARVDNDTRNRVIDEAVAISMADRKAQIAIFGFARNSPAYAPLMLGWYRAQLGRSRRATGQSAPVE